MKIAVGVAHKKEIAQLAASGADEFYAGIVPEDWSEKYGYWISPNRRESRQSNLTTFKELEGLVNEVHDHGRKVYLTVNAHEYTNRQLPRIRTMIDQSVDIGVDGLIVADPGLILMLQEWQIQTDVVLSGDFGISNSKSLAWLHETQIIQRVIFPRHMMISQMEKIISTWPDFEYEAVNPPTMIFTSLHLDLICFTVWITS